MNWIYLIIAGIFEIGGPLGFKLAHGSNFKIAWIALSVISMALSGYFLYVAQKTIPIGTAYIIWTSIGAIGTFIIGVAMFSDPLTFMRSFAILLILSGIIILKIAN